MNSPRGFTLIELTIVLALVALLLTIAVPRYFHSVENGKLSVQRQNLAALRDALDKFRGDQGKYPDELEDLVKKKYLRAIPVDPVTQLPNWTVIAPEDETQGRVFDVRSATEAVEAGGAAPAASKVARGGSTDRAAEARGGQSQPLPAQGNRDGR
jgi:general secretion pathway protein G